MMSEVGLKWNEYEPFMALKEVLLFGGGRNGRNRHFREVGEKCFID